MAFMYHVSWLSIKHGKDPLITSNSISIYIDKAQVNFSLIGQLSFQENIMAITIGHSHKFDLTQVGASHDLQVNKSNLALLKTLFNGLQDRYLTYNFSHISQKLIYKQKHIYNKETSNKETYHLKYNPVPPETIGTRPLLRMSLVACLASSKNCPTE